MARKKSFKLINLGIPLFIVILMFSFIGYHTLGKKPLAKMTTTQAHDLETTFWKYKCIDTMKTSRDKARDWSKWEGLDRHIEMEMDAISYTGANCVAIDTPYDAEFIPYLRHWVSSARKHNLSIWYRGNWSSWEGWFDYPKDMTTDTHLQKTEQFILNHQDLFEDGDIFTPAPEGENGGPFNQVEIDEYDSFRAFLIAENNLANSTFKTIGKKVHVNWLSMNGGLAKRMLDQNTIDMIGGLVTIDHYINDPMQMGEFIRYFADNFGASVAIGEFGAPIPEINGQMTEKEQADFLEMLFSELYLNREHVYGISYWDLYDGSTALLNSDGSKREAIEVVRKYFLPGNIKGIVKSNRNTILPSIEIVIDNGDLSITADGNGNYSIPVVEGNYKIHFSAGDKYETVTEEIDIKAGEKKEVNVILKEKDTGLAEKFQRLFRID